MKVGVIQSSFIPWRGYFDFIDSVDIFVFHDDIQYTKGDWRNRNKIKTEKGVQWITVPVSYKKVSQLICNTRLDYSAPWQDKILATWHTHYHKSPYYKESSDILSIIRNMNSPTISQLNVNLIRRICDYLDIKTPMILSSDLNITGTKTERLINILKKLNADTYLSGPTADSYLDKEFFVRNNIKLMYKSYKYYDYPQLWGDFAPQVTILDLIANCGPKSKQLIQSAANDVIVA
jgi:hypothetical protein